MDDLDRLMELCPPPPSVTTPEGGARAFIVPDDYARLIATYGLGCFDEFLWLFAEGAGAPHLDLAEQTRLMREILQRKKNPQFHAVLEESGVSAADLIQWATTSGADSFFWLPAGSPETWKTIVVEAGVLSFSVVDRTATSILLGLLDGTLRMPELADDFPSDEIGFEPWLPGGR